MYSIIVTNDEHNIVSCRLAENAKDAIKILAEEKESLLTAIEIDGYSKDDFDLYESSNTYFDLIVSEENSYYGRIHLIDD